ncbi:Hsp20/alpha crystallin family protein [Ligilactobacillus agilis]|jgi:HSP20 family protein|uniref:Heat shock protein Hsp20 n=1 Tax=Ligilactobacillus agilis DSM 20509 TaxID=1423718 RepID=A0A0R2A934_9LACO|nr:Hsp20/alpha crystallin family protein [Ligilactobacillus agilis]ASR41585.1 heat-shock protein Hsp20 [Ligilactobacillus agilis]KRM63205.1 heat shock protein Hsp20 [Ligilactobacillus agilis DSM 20509]MBL1056273.1 Hsp20/alpha crystallin family protein [Ligilactobacillus agilis]MBM6763466.1 Hsp20/alpha crystallin family protein [Ligilactobacillus agilis]MCL8204654.1 Hsp20/alpha crystallin family protein [Ligilactobacillus agilis]
MANELNNRFNELMKGGDDFFSNLGRSFFNGFDDSFKEMKTDISESDTAYTVAVDLPGVDKKDIDIDFKDHALTISAKRDSFSDESDAKGNLLSSERSYGRFTRQYQFPNVDKDKISAKYEAGVLTVTLPKTAEEISNSHKIEIE